MVIEKMDRWRCGERAKNLNQKTNTFGRKKIRKRSESSNGREGGREESGTRRW